MFNKLMNALQNKAVGKDEKGNNDEAKDKIVNIKFTYRHLGVNAQANNYAFAEDCYSQWTVSPAEARTHTMSH